MLNDKGFAQLKERNIDQQQALKQVERLRKSTNYITDVKPATIGDGIIRLDNDSLNELLCKFYENRQYHNFTKLVLTSRAARPPCFYPLFFNNVHFQSRKKHFTHLLSKLYVLVKSVFSTGRTEISTFVQQFYQQFKD